MSETTPDELLIELEQMHEQAEAHADQLDDLAAEIPDPERIERIAKLLDITERIERLEENADLPEPEPENENERDLAANGRGPTNPWGSGGR